MASFIYYLTGLGTILSASLILPILVGLAAGEYDVATRLAIYGAIFGFIAACMMMGTTGRAGALGRMQGIVLMVVAWFLFPMLMAIPFADILSIPYTTALFETVSGFTTTGASNLATLENVPVCMILLRAMLQWLGALATIISFTLVLAPNGIGGLTKDLSYNLAAAVLTSPNRLMRYCIATAELFLLITTVCFGLLMITGTKPYDALILAMTAVSTGGFLPSDAPLDETLNVVGMLIVATFMLIGATSVFWHRMVFTFNKTGLLEHRESYALLAIALVLTIYISQVLISASGLSGFQQLNAMAEGIYNAVSIVSTSGLESRPGVFSVLSPIVVLTFILIGGGSFSTAGGMKIFRIGTMSAVAYHEINRLIYPNAVSFTQFSDTRYNIERMKALWSFFILTIFVILFGGLFLSLSDFDFQAAFTAAVAAFSNAGPAYSPLWAASGAEGWPQYFEMSASHKMILCVLMILGRLEIIAVIAALNIYYWIER